MESPVGKPSDDDHVCQCLYHTCRVDSHCWASGVPVLRSSKYSILFWGNRNLPYWRCRYKCMCTNQKFLVS